MGSENIDRLSSLPDDVLTHILDFIPTKLAVRTSILAKRWRHSWKYVTNLQFDDIRSFSDLDSFTKYVDRVLELYKTTHVKSFRLDFSNLWVPKATNIKWIDEAIRYWDNWIITSPIDLPLLKTLDIEVYTNPNLNAFKIIPSCPLLETLSLQVSHHWGDEVYNFNIPTLKRLKLIIGKGLYIDKVVLNVPNLEEFSVSGSMSSPFVMENFPPLVSVTLSCSFESGVDQYWVELLTGISGAKSLTVHPPSNIPSKSPMPKFLNLKHFEFRANYNYPLDWLLIKKFIENSYELERLCVEEMPISCYWVEPEDSCWIEPQSVLTCMLNNLRTIKFVSFKGRKSYIQFMAYILRNAQVLKTLAIMCDCIPVEEELRLKAELLKLPRASRYCEIHFIASGSRSTST